MIPVSHLAREGLVPITMGMVLCNEPADRIDPYVKMVHGLHAEGVVRKKKAFHGTLTQKKVADQNFVGFPSSLRESASACGIPPHKIPCQ